MTFADKCNNFCIRKVPYCQWKATRRISMHKVKQKQLQLLRILRKSSGMIQKIWRMNPCALLRTWNVKNKKTLAQCNIFIILILVHRSLTELASVQTTECSKNVLISNFKLVLLASKSKSKFFPRYSRSKSTDYYHSNFSRHILVSSMVTDGRNKVRLSSSVSTSLK